MDGSRFDSLLRSWTASSSRRGVTRSLTGLGLAGLLGVTIGLDETEARKRKKKHKNKKTCRGGTRKCGKRCIPSASCCSAADCDDGNACASSVCNSDGACGQVNTPDLTGCGGGKQCSGGECAAPPTCRSTGDPCILPSECCGECVIGQGMGTCIPGEEPNQPCLVPEDCASGTCIGFVCTP
jgi:hypothetical protein